MWPILCTVLIVLLVVTLVVAILLQRSRVQLQLNIAQADAELRNLESQRHRLDTELAVSKHAIEDQANERAEYDKLRQENTELVKQVERLTADRDALADLHKKIDTRLNDLASDSLEKSNKHFLELAKKTFEKEQGEAEAALKQREVAIDTMLKPIRETLSKTNSAVEELKASGKESFGGLRQQLITMLGDQKALRAETANLVKALRRPEVRGQWGEMQLRRVAELAGMAAHCDFTEQTHIEGESGGLRPDLVVSLPGGREIVVDAKTPITAFIDAAESESDSEREQNLIRHVKHIEDKVSQLSSKRYQDHFASADFVVLFIPGESFLYAAAQRKPDLIETAMNRNVVIATPTTLISLLKVVALGWREEQLADNAKKIRDLGQELHKRIATLTQHIENLGKAVGKTVEHYNKFVGSYDTQVLVQARRFQELGADSPKELPADGEIKTIESTTREVRGVEEVSS
jgi:DNA recombination protein RmuC